MNHTLPAPSLLAILLLATVAGTPAAAAQAAQPASRGLASADPSSLGLSGARLRFLDDAVQAAIEAGEIPGAVVLIARRGRIGYLRAFGHRALSPEPEPMTIDTVFDLASLTKVVATAPSVLLLVERGKIRLDARVSRYLPEFVGGGKDSITVRQLLTHHSGLRPDFDLSVPWHGYAAALNELWKEVLQKEPGKEFIYSDLNFIALGEIVGRLSGKSLNEFARENIFEPLGMRETTFNPPQEWQGRIAPTESRARSLEYLKGKAPQASSEILRGSVHDPTAWRMGGVAGHAGLFSNAREIAVFAETLLNEGRFGGRRLFSPLTVRAMTQPPPSPLGMQAIRGLGWDIDSRLSVPRGDLLAGGFGHTGFAGASLWVHPPTDTIIVIMTSRLHPDGKGDVTHLRALVANVVASAILDPP